MLSMGESTISMGHVQVRKLLVITKGNTSFDSFVSHYLQ